MIVQHGFLLQQMLELSDALNRKRDPDVTRRKRYADEQPTNLARQQLLRHISERRKAGDSFGCIAHALNQRGMRGEHGGRWYGASVRNLILRMQAETP